MELKEEFYKIPIENLCEILSHNIFSKEPKNEIIGRGLSATVYLTKDNKVLKEIYLENKNVNKDKIENSNIINIKESRKFNELYINYLLSYEKEFSHLKSYVIPFHSYDVCIKKEKIFSLLIKFDNGGSTLYEQLGNLNIKELRYVVIRLMYIIKELNENGIYHNDIHPGNVFYNPETLEIKLGDWGRGIYEIKQKNKYESLDLFFTSLYIDTIFMNYLNDMISKDLNILREIKLKKLYNILKDNGMYNKYIRDVQKEIDYQRRNFTYKPAKFLKSLEPDIYIRFLKSYFAKNIFLRNQLISLSKISPQILSYLESLI